MKPAPFEYARPETVEEVLSILAEHGDEAKILAGGQSLVPLLNFRMLRPAILVDVNRVAALDFLEVDGDILRVGALTRHLSLELSDAVRTRLPVLRRAMEHVAHVAIRSRGTIGGSLSHADPAAELPMMARLLDARIHVRNSGGERVVDAADFFLAPLTTSLEPEDLVTEVRLSLPPQGSGWAFEEYAQRSGDFAFAAVSAVVEAPEGRIEDIRLAAMGVDETPVRLDAIEEELRGRVLDGRLVDGAVELARQSVNPNTDLKASAEHRRHLMGVLTRRVITQAVGRTGKAAA